VSEKVNRKLPVKNTTAVQLFTVHNNPDYHNAQRYRQTDRWTERKDPQATDGRHHDANS